MIKQKGREYIDPAPVEWPLGVDVPESLEQKIARMVRMGVSDHAEQQGLETFEESNDFDVDDPEALPGSVHELDDDQAAIAADEAAVRRIPKQFREAYEREIQRKRNVAEQKLKDMAAEKPQIEPAKLPADSSPS